MTTPQEKLFAHVSAHLPRDWPREPRTRLVTLAAVPLVWGMLGPGASRVAAHQALLAVVARWLPPRATVLVLGERAYRLQK
ncbi:MAG: hypothetical protein AB1671_25990 [Thermodesulfobacteriota bacterium]